MEYRKLGSTGLKVSRLCFGSLGLGPLQANLPVGQGAKVIRTAIEYGVNFIDTAELYGTYPYIAAALRGFNEEVHIASKSYAYTYEMMEKSVHQALRELGTEHISLFLLHEMESASTLKGHHEALEYLVKAKKDGLISAIGISTHFVAAVRAAASFPEIEVIHPLLNMDGLGIVDGGAEEMLEAIRFARLMGKGIYGMKALAGGHLHHRSLEALAWAWGQPELDSVAVGMKTEAEVLADIKILEKSTSGEDPANAPDLELLLKQVAARPKSLLVEEWCEGCGTCVSHCPSRALQVNGARVSVDRKVCVLCGYCGAACPNFALKII